MKRQIWGHRGYRGAGNPPENSLSAFQWAIACGASGIELDVRLTQDGALAVFHDAGLLRMTGVERELDEFTLEDLRRLRLRTADGKLSKEHIPTLGEVLDLVDGARRASPFVVNVEIKDPCATAAVARELRRRLGEGWQPEHFLVSSFDMDCLRELRGLWPAAPLGRLFDCPPEEVAQRLEETADLTTACVNLPFSSLTAEVAALIEHAGAYAVVWTPDEVNPSKLTPAEREQLAKRLKEGEFVAITDFPKETLQLLRPNRARATATGFLAACLSYGERDILFRPTESGLENLKSPGEYPELERFGFSELQLTAEDGVEFTVWERLGGRGLPHFLLFHGNRAHWGDTGGGERNRDRRARLKFIEELAAAGAGVTAVTLRGFGKSTAVPSEAGFLRDLRGVEKHLSEVAIDSRRLAIVGESLGTWAATQSAVDMTAQNRPPALLSLQNPFTCMAEVGEEVVSHFPIVRSLSLRLSAAALDRHVLKNHFYTAKLFEGLSGGTAVHIATSGKDDLIHPSHSDKLAEIAAKRGLKVIRDVYPDALHHNIPPVDFARRVVSLGVESCAATSGNEAPASESRVSPLASDRVLC